MALGGIDQPFNVRLRLTLLMRLMSSNGAQAASAIPPLQQGDQTARRTDRENATAVLSLFRGS
jgi:hypothetical protein